MNDTRKKCIGWFLIILLFVSHIVINNIIFFKINQQESENSINGLTEKMDELRVLLEVNQSRVEKRIFDLKRNLHTQCEQGDSSLRHKNLAKLLLLVIKMKNSLLREAKFDNHINSIKPLISELDDPEIENAVNELENLKEVDTLRGLKLSFEKNMTVINYNKSNLLKKIISNWIKIDDRSDPLRLKLAEIEELISDNNWQSIATAISDLTYPEFKPWLNKLNDFIVAFKNTSIIYRHLLQYIS